MVTGHPSGSAVTRGPASAVAALMGADSRMLLRDPLLAWVVVLPFGLALLLRLLVSPIAAALYTATGFELAPYHPLIMGGFLMTAPGIVGLVVGFLVLDERDARTLLALRVTPLSSQAYLLYRIGLPLLLGIFSTLAAYPLAALVPLPIAHLAAITSVAGMTAPILALVLATAAPNKVAGFAVVKVVNAVNLLPILAFFLPLPVQLAAGVLPTYWPMRALWSAAAGEGYAIWLLGGMLVNTAALLLIARAFRRRLLRSG